MFPRQFPLVQSIHLHININPNLRKAHRTCNLCLSMSLITPDSLRNHTLPRRMIRRTLLYLLTTLATDTIIRTIPTRMDCSSSIQILTTVPCRIRSLPSVILNRTTCLFPQGKKNIILQVDPHPHGATTVA